MRRFELFRLILAAALFAALCVACARDHASVAQAEVTRRGAATSSADAADVAVRGPTGVGTPCGALDCRQFDSDRDAFLDALVTDPLVVAVGEAHAPKGASMPSAATRFTTDLLPALAGRASDLLVELMMPPTGCADAAAEVREQQQPVTARQAEQNQNEYVVMGEKARSLGIVPDLLRPSCADLDAVQRSGQDAIGASLELIARLTRTQALRLVDRDARSDADRNKMVVTYGGMLHNDLAPRPETAAWTFAPALDAYVQSRFVAIDLVVPEFIGDDDSWRSFAWRPHYDRARLGSHPTLFRTGGRSFVLVFAAQ
jgi:hypothetical protein